MESSRKDIVAVVERDPACRGGSQALLYFKGFHVIATHRITHCLWLEGRKGLASALANRVSEVLHVDLHPAAVIGSGVMLDHATGIVIGETARIGNNVSMLHDVTLGGSGLDRYGRRHPVVGDGVLIGAGTVILGPVNIGHNVKIGAGTQVFTDIPDNCTVVGNPGQIIGRSKGLSQAPSESMNQTNFDVQELWGDYMI